MAPLLKLVGAGMVGSTIGCSGPGLGPEVVMSTLNATAQSPAGSTIGGVNTPGDAVCGVCTVRVPVVQGAQAVWLVSLPTQLVFGMMKTETLVMAPTWLGLVVVVLLPRLTSPPAS